MSSVVSLPSQEDTCSMLLFCLEKNVPPDEDATDYVFHAVGNQSNKRVWPNQNVISSKYQNFILNIFISIKYYDKSHVAKTWIKK